MNYTQTAIKTFFYLFLFFPVLCVARNNSLKVAYSGQCEIVGVAISTNSRVDYLIKIYNILSHTIKLIGVSPYTRRQNSAFQKQDNYVQ